MEDKENISNKVSEIDDEEDEIKTIYKVKNMIDEILMNYTAFEYNNYIQEKVKMIEEDKITSEFGICFINYLEKENEYLRKQLNERIEFLKNKINEL